MRFFRLTGDYRQCIREYDELIARYAADVVGHNQIALCASKLRDLRRASGQNIRIRELDSMESRIRFGSDELSSKLNRPLATLSFDYQ